MSKMGDLALELEEERDEVNREAGKRLDAVTLLHKSKENLVARILNLYDDLDCAEHSIGVCTQRLERAREALRGVEFEIRTNVEELDMQNGDANEQG